ncbi:MAG: 4-(cytidine 5'-diphospho)-2-C-methyl-D-erythritol kinase, partial [Chitinophagaceae bacterium]
IALYITGNPVPGNEKDNLCLRAWHILKKDFHHKLPPVNIHLHKVIPTGAGLGGGSSDATFMLRLLNEKYNLNLKQEQFLDYADQLGCDCAFFLQNKPCYATGRGNELYPLTQRDLSGYQFVLVCPDIHINTAWAYNKVIPNIPHHSVLDLIREPVETWEETVINDFERPVFETYPQLKKIKDTLYKQGAVYASLSGSGATVYGIFRKGSTKQKALSFENARIFYF